MMVTRISHLERLVLREVVQPRVVDLVAVLLNVVREEENTLARQLLGRSDKHPSAI